jgi:RND superfamily putative drug exporter
VPGATANVTGWTAQSLDFNNTMKSHAPYVFVFVVGLAFVLLLVTFRSIVIPLKAIVLNLLSVGAAYGSSAIGTGTYHAGSNGSRVWDRSLSGASQ